MASSDPAEAASSLIYPFSPETPWDYFRLGAPLTSSVERGQRKTVYKSKKIYCRKRRKAFNARSNRPHREMSLLCSCDGGCLMRRPGARFSKVPKLYGPFSGATIPFVTQERRAFNSSNFTVNFLFVTLKACSC